MTANYEIFDAFADESGLTEEVNKGFNYAGENYDLPVTLPAAAVLRLMRKIKTNELGAIDDFLTSILGEEQYERLLDSGIALERLALLVGKITEMYAPQTAQVTTNPKVARGKK